MTCCCYFYLMFGFKKIDKLFHHLIKFRIFKCFSDGCCSHPLVHNSILHVCLFHSTMNAYMWNITAIGHRSLPVTAESCFLLSHHHTTSHKYLQTYSSSLVDFSPNHTDYILIAPFPNQELLFSAHLHVFTFWISRLHFGLHTIHSIQKKISEKLLFVMNDNLFLSI